MILNENMTRGIFQDRECLEVLTPKINPWIDHGLENYPIVDAKTKGSYGEVWVAKLLSTMLGFTVFPRENPGHDRIVYCNGIPIKIEVKFSVASVDEKNPVKTLRDRFTFNHFSNKKDWTRAIIIGVNSPDETYAYWFTKEDFTANISDANQGTKYFGRQQGGQDGGNDDWMLKTSKKKWAQLLNESWVHSLAKW
jgi:hypothetical protein